ncbi:hypothetical protein [Dyadobacter sp. NIV53]|uniref:hypothetical protein n=1 Tax=Dyadobacter sp. NIV53 TaxID=2861765 RepID=UPI001E5F97C7|nr:hypothetical protein [Dyadobacter sp. NIV53]
MLRKTHAFILVMLSFTWSFTACRQTASDPKDASEKLTATSNWMIDEIIVNDAVTFKNGKMIKQFGGVDFDRYMETVRFKANGEFEGHFAGDDKPLVLYWKLNEKDITIAAADTKGGAWTIIPRDVTDDSFIMKTQSTAYDYPRMTKIELSFKR